MGAQRWGDLLYLTKPLGVGMVTTAQKKGMVQAHHLAAAEANMDATECSGDLHWVHWMGCMR